MGGDFIKPECCQRALKDEAGFEAAKKGAVVVADLKAEELAGAFLVGGHGVCADFVGEPAKPLVALVEALLAQDKVVGATCHGVFGLFDCKAADGSPLLKGKKVTGFSDSEEAAVGLTATVPFTPEARMKELGAAYEKAADWNPCAVADGKIVTGQNPASSTPCAEKMVELMA